jgi:hypothetical protein
MLQGVAEVAATSVQGPARVRDVATITGASCDASLELYGQALSRRASSAA